MLELIFAFFALLGAIDKIAGNKFRLGTAFEKGLMTAGPLILSMTGMIVLSPVLADALSGALVPLCGKVGIDPSVLSGFFPVDAGGASMAYNLSEDAPMRAYHGIIVASMLGATICPAIPLSLQMTDKKIHPDVLTGLLCGIATIPLGCMVAGLFVGCAVLPLLVNSIPLLVISGLICWGLLKKPQFVVRLFGWIGKLLMAFVLFGLLVGMLAQFGDIHIFKNAAPLSESFVIVGNIAVILAGVFPLLEILSRLLKKPMAALAKRIGVTDNAVLGFMTNLANSIPVFSMLEDMDKKGRILNMAFAVSAGYVLGDHLAFILSYDRSYALPMVLGKLIGGLAAIALGLLICKKDSKKPVA